MPYVYMLECADGSYYVGSTRSLHKRVWEHLDGRGSEYTRHRLPVSLVWFEQFDRIDEAFAREKQIQNWSRTKRKALIDRRYADLPDLAERYSRRRRRERLEADASEDDATPT